MSALTLEKANSIITTALEKASELKLKPLAVSVFDAGGHLKAFQKQDGTSILRFEIASGKAFGALAVGAGSRWLNNQAKERPHFLEGLSNVSGGKIVAVPGGVLIRNSSNEIIGAVGISGDTSDNDELAAIAGIEANGFVADAG
ncbi:heme-binding protein [Ochrobactrum sp. Marseille-Q0166]|uniref:GlcG/HbpS family heme-binding protein n=1 Tax=Ochrobactrum sp. Marseille-Q0166 TaxID=2761105 RepID=UPI00165505C6|nr:heme-binding protein [Ochrobactrum sp. Marseille-Q0166]MBC8716622.1 heme-binding protein [Ochrobactrum sp. Marseille-Q0166]